ncbi:hypothetical protein ETD83_40870, partial [Actinomadura soli]
MVDELLDELPFTGRDAELDAIESFFREGTDAGMLVVGASGAGRTRLAKEALVRLERAGVPTEWVAATPVMASIPFGAVAHLLPQGGACAYTDPLAVLRAVTSEIRQRAGGERLVLVVDNAHLLDDGSLAVLCHLFRHGVTGLIATLRTDVQLAAAKAEMWGDCRSRQLHLAPLSDAAVERLIDAVLPGHVDGPTRARLRRAARGNPRALRNLLHGAIETHTLRRRHRVWRWDGELPPTPALAAWVTGAVGKVAPDVSALLEIVACAEPLEVPLLEQLTSADTVDAAERAGLLTIERSQASLARPLHGEVLRAELTPYRSRTIYRRLAALSPRPTNDLLRAASWQVRGGGPVRPTLLADGARAALAHGAPDLAEQLANAARNTAPGAAADLLLAEVLLHRGDTARAAALLSRWPDAPGADWAVARASVLYWGTGQVAAAERELAKAAIDPDAATAAATHARILLFDGRRRQGGTGPRRPRPGRTTGERRTQHRPWRRRRPATSRSPPT